MKQITIEYKLSSVTTNDSNTVYINNEALFIINKYKKHYVNWNLLLELANAYNSLKAGC